MKSGSVIDLKVDRWRLIDYPKKTTTFHKMVIGKPSAEAGVITTEKVGTIAVQEGIFRETTYPLRIDAYSEQFVRGFATVPYDPFKAGRFALVQGKPLPYDAIVRFGTQAYPQIGTEVATHTGGGAAILGKGQSFAGGYYSQHAGYVLTPPQRIPYYTPPSPYALRTFSLTETATVTRYEGIFALPKIDAINVKQLGFGYVDGTPTLLKREAFAILKIKDPVGGWTTTALGKQAQQMGMRQFAETLTKTTPLMKMAPTTMQITTTPTTIVPVSPTQLVSLTDVRTETAPETAQTMYTPPFTTSSLMPGTVSIQSPKTEPAREEYPITTTRPTTERISIQRFREDSARVVRPDLISAVSPMQASEPIRVFDQSTQKIEVEAQQTTPITERITLPTQIPTIIPVIRQFPPSPPPPTPFITPPPPITSGFDIPSGAFKRSRQLTQAFRVEVKMGGEWKAFGTMPKMAAIKTGKRITGYTPARSFRLIPAGLTRQKDIPYSPDLSKYYRKGEKYIEKTKYAIDEPGEFEGITMKGWAAQRRSMMKRLI